jgi:hypothetical protein
VLRSVDWQLFTDVPRQTIGSIFGGKAVQEERYSCLTLEDEIGSLSRKVGGTLPTYPTQNPTTAQNSFTPRRKPEITQELQWLLLHKLNKAVTHSGVQSRSEHIQNTPHLPYMQLLEHNFFFFFFL